MTAVKSGNPGSCSHRRACLRQKEQDVLLVKKKYCVVISYQQFKAAQINIYILTIDQV